MKRKERFLAALRREVPDRVPMFDFLFQQPLFEELIGHRSGGEVCSGLRPFCA